MSAAEYLTARGWSPGQIEPPFKTWRDPSVNRMAQESAGNDRDSFTVATDDAITIQRARDAAEERAAWVRFAAAVQIADQMHGIAQHRDDVAEGERQGEEDYAPGCTAGNVAEGADDLLAEYRARFAVEVEP